MPSANSPSSNNRVTSRYSTSRAASSDGNVRARRNVASVAFSAFGDLEFNPFNVFVAQGLPLRDNASIIPSTFSLQKVASISLAVACSSLAGAAVANAAMT